MTYVSMFIQGHQPYLLLPISKLQTYLSLGGLLCQHQQPRILTLHLQCPQGDCLFRKVVHITVKYQ